MQALWRQGRSLLLKPLDTDNRFIDVLYTPVVSISFSRHTRPGEHPLTARINDIEIKRFGETECVDLN
jgi:hypothetical protein